MRAAGFTMVELLVTMTIAAILLMLAVPNYSEFMRNTRIRGVADSIAGAMRLAQTEAIRLNQAVELIVDPSTGWSIVEPVAPRTLHSEPYTESAGQVGVALSPPGATKLTYSPIGQLITPTNPSDGSTTLTSVAVTHAITPSRALRVINEAFGAGVRVCDKATDAHSSLQCPVGVP
jgi:type IV fimbrial biogenesis protein FimT